MITLTTQQQAMLLHKLTRENRRNGKRFLKDLGGTGSADELDAVLAAAQANKTAVQEAEKLNRTTAAAARAVELGLSGRVAEILAQLRVAITERGIPDSEVAARCGWPASQLSAYLAGTKSPGIENLAKLAEALGCRWVLTAEQQ